jgi:hypothetical protein
MYTVSGRYWPLMWRGENGRAMEVTGPACTVGAAPNESGFREVENGKP